MSETEGARLQVFLDGFYPRKEGGIARLADDAGIRRATFYPWFRGEAEPDLKTLNALADALSRKANRPVTRAEIVAAMDGHDLEADRRARIAEEVEEAVAPLRQLMRDAGLLRAGEAPDANSHAGQR